MNRYQTRKITATLTHLRRAYSAAQYVPDSERENSLPANIFIAFSHAARLAYPAISIGDTHRLMYNPHFTPS